MTQSKPAGHYTAIVEVVHSTPEWREGPKNGGNYATSVDTIHPKVKREVAKIVVRADSLDKLKERLVSHTELLEDDAEMSEDA